MKHTPLFERWQTATFDLADVSGQRTVRVTLIARFSQENWVSFHRGGDLVVP